jgi:hypothetical protein
MSNATRMLAAIPLVAGIACASAPAAAPEAAPASPTAAPAAADDVVEAYLAAMNAGSAEALKAFEETYRAPGAPALAGRSVDERVARAQAMRERWGELTLWETVKRTPEVAVVIVDTAQDGGLWLEFDLDASGKLDALRIAPASTAEPTEESRRDAVERLAEILGRAYVFPDVAEAMATALREGLAEGAFDEVRTESALAYLLTDMLQAISNDKHLRIVTAPSGPAGQPRQRGSAMPNRGFRKVEVQDGNVGYIRFDQFITGDDAERVASAAMNFVANSDAIIFDLRFNGGGSPAQIAYITSYLFDEPTHLNSFYDRDGNRTSESWTHAEVPGTRVGHDVPVYVLTSRFTFSGAEEFAYNLQALGRATIIGEVTGGGAHPVQLEPVGERFMAAVPFARAENPITRTNWEGVGVTPDIEVPSDEALDRALALAGQSRRGSRMARSSPASH